MAATARPDDAARDEHARASGPAPSEAAAGGTLRYQPGLDGLRAIAVMLVILHHTSEQLVPGTAFFPGGFLGVDLFFVLSGFLITTLLIERRAEGRGIRRFYARRALRLLPAVAALLAVNLVVELANGVGWARPLNSVLVVGTYTTNWAELRGWLLSPYVLHLWSLAIEEQFYLVWPLLLLGAIRIGISRRTLAAFTILLAAASAIWCAHLWFAGVNALSIYIRTEARVDELLIGAAMALLRVDLLMARTARRWRSALGVLGLLTLLVAAIWLPGDSPALYVGGFALIAILVGCTITAEVAGPWLAHPLLASRPFVVIGRLSYSLYLWHFLVFVVIQRMPDWPSALRVAVAWSVTAIAATLSWAVVEQPALRLKHRIGAAAPPAASASAPSSTAPPT